MPSAPAEPQQLFWGAVLQHVKHYQRRKDFPLSGLSSPLTVTAQLSESGTVPVNNNEKTLFDFGARFDLGNGLSWMKYKSEGRVELVKMN